MDRNFERLLRTGWVGGGADSVPRQYLGLYLSAANKTRQIYKTNQNKVIDINRIMLTLQNVVDVIRN